jgi:cyclopropane fatty-acyl-phospholipid synthase-like methyltransferase
MMNDNNSKPPSTSEQFNKVYRSPIASWAWRDIRIPKELNELVETKNPKTSLELGCGLGGYSRFMVKQGIKTIGVDFSSVAIENAKKGVANDECKPTFIKGDVTNLEMLTEQFDVSFDVGCFHCLNEEGQQKYVSEIYRLLKPGATHLIWALDIAPSEIKLNHDYIAKTFEKGFQLVNSKFSRRRIIASHWYWLVRKK